MAEVLKEPWLWVIVVAVILIGILPFAVVLLLLNLPPPLAFAATLILVACWGIAAGYKDWIINKRKEEKQKQA